MGNDRYTLTAAEAADRLGVSESTALNDAKNERLDAIDRGEGSRPRWLISERDVREVVKSGGRPDRRSSRWREPDEPSAEPTGEPSEARRQLAEARARISELEATVSRLGAELARTRTIARNANVAVQSQTESLQQFLIDEYDAASP